MADIKTHLRELSVALGIHRTISNIEKEIILRLTPQDFIEISRQIVTNNIDIANNILSLDNFNSEHLSIINNGLVLGERIVNLNLSNDYNSIQWLGSDTQKNDPIDLIVGNIGFSLKEESFILENMGLYKYINLLTNSNFQRGLHVFQYFASNEYNSWFQCAWNKLLSSNLPWETNNEGRYTSKIYSDDSYIYFAENNDILSRIPKRTITVDEYNSFTKARSREKVFAKWIRSQLENDNDYLTAKSACSNKAGEELCRYINNNLNPVNLSRLLQIYPESYYYAKSTSNELSIFYVPSLSEFNNLIQVTDVSYSVPYSQLNIITTISNNETNNQLLLRNECRFSHGQFNGTPEAKMYYDRGNDLSVIYNRIV